MSMPLEMETSPQPVVDVDMDTFDVDTEMELGNHHSPHLPLEQQKDSTMAPDAHENDVEMHEVMVPEDVGDVIVPGSADDVVISGVDSMKGMEGSESIKDHDLEVEQIQQERQEIQNILSTEDVHSSGKDMIGEEITMTEADVLDYEENDSV